MIRGIASTCVILFGVLNLLNCSGTKHVDTGRPQKAGESEGPKGLSAESLPGDTQAMVDDMKSHETKETTEYPVCSNVVWKDENVPRSDEFTKVMNNYRKKAPLVPVTARIHGFSYPEYDDGDMPPGPPFTRIRLEIIEPSSFAGRRLWASYDGELPEQSLWRTENGIVVFKMLQVQFDKLSIPGSEFHVYLELFDEVRFPTCKSEQ